MVSRQSIQRSDSKFETEFSVCRFIDYINIFNSNPIFERFKLSPPTLLRAARFRIPIIGQIIYFASKNFNNWLALRRGENKICLSLKWIMIKKQNTVRSKLSCNMIGIGRNLVKNVESLLRWIWEHEEEIWGWKKVKNVFTVAEGSNLWAQKVFKADTLTLINFDHWEQLLVESANSPINGTKKTERQEVFISTYSMFVFARISSQCSEFLGRVEKLMKCYCS